VTRADAVVHCNVDAFRQKSSMTVGHLALALDSLTACGPTRLARFDLATLTECRLAVKTRHPLMVDRSAFTDEQVANAMLAKAPPSMASSTHSRAQLDGRLVGTGGAR